MNTPPLLQYILEKRHHQYRRTLGWDLAGEYAAAGLSPRQRMTDRFCRMCAAQTPVLLPDEQICFLRTTADLPDIFTQAEWADIKTQHFIHEMGYLSNLCPDYEGVICDGLLARREKADECSRRSMDALLELTDRYVVDGAVNGSATLVKGASGLLRLLENGYVRTYGALMTFGSVIIGAVLILGRLA